ncbi:MAG: PAS domain-containing protein [Proteobacteria bacterium]|nr:PAS domain-containing protein [Pseudomonadota bacterium]MBU1059212.1 PAS domain-containing protein [Pseudomonadota bacterium]
MKTENKIFLLSLLLGVFVWVIDSLLDYFIFYEGIFAELLLTDIPRHELYIRVLILVCFAVFGLICSRLIIRQKKAEQKVLGVVSFQQQLLDTIPIPIFYKNAEFSYMGCNKSFEKFLGMDRQEIIGKSVHDLAPPELAAVYQEKDLELINNPGVQHYESDVKSKQKDVKRQVIFHKATFEKADGALGGLIGVILDITDRKKAENEKEHLIGELQDALEKVKLLSGFLPICASCKNIRDDQGYWNQIET